jgi:uncharacterized membrane protein YqjE
MVIAALLLHYLWTEYRSYGARRFTTLFFCIVIAMNTVWNVTKASMSGYYFEAVTYKTLFFHQDLIKAHGLKLF